MAYTHELRAALNEEDPKTGKRKLRRVVDKLVSEALRGKPWAILEIGARLDGKPRQTIETQQEPSDVILSLIRAVGRGEFVGKEHLIEALPSKIDTE